MRGSITRNKSGKGAPWAVSFPGPKRRIFKRFWDYHKAERFLTGLRYEYDRGTLDERDYQRGNPLSLEAQVRAYLMRIREKRSYRHIETHLYRLVDFMGSDRNMKSIGYKEFDDFRFHLRQGGLSAKTTHNILSNTKTFMRWSCTREGLPMPDFPRVDFELGWRKTVDKSTQQRIIEEVKRISSHVDPKVGIAVEWLARYYSVRPVELLHIQEQDFDFELGGVNIRYNKERRPKWVPMLWEDLDLVRSFPPPIRGDLYFFRYKGRRFGKKRLYKWWKKACANLGIKGVDLYGGTRHSTVRALRGQYTPEQIKRGSMHSTNRAFERYFQVENDEVREIYASTISLEKRQGVIRK